MGTPSIVGVPHGDSWRGRSVHWDGYPTSVGKQVWAVVQRDGAEVARKTFTEAYYGWSQINAEQPDISNVKLTATDKKLDPWDLREKYGFNHPKTRLLNFDDGGQFANVPGYGVAYTSDLIPHLGPDYRQSEETDWFGPHEQFKPEGIWAFVIADNALWVFDDEALIGQYRWDSTEPDWASIEKGA